MNRNLFLAGLFLVCAVMNLVNVVLNRNGIGFLLGGVWLAASILMYTRYRKEKNNDTQEEGK